MISPVIDSYKPVKRNDEFVFKQGRRPRMLSCEEISLARKAVEMFEKRDSGGLHIFTF